MGDIDHGRLVVALVRVV